VSVAAASMMMSSQFTTRPYRWTLAVILPRPTDRGRPPEAANELKGIVTPGCMEEKEEIARTELYSCRRFSPGAIIPGRLPAG
jgi:hypothetical protein